MKMSFSIISLVAWGTLVMGGCSSSANDSLQNSIGRSPIPDSLMHRYHYTQLHLGVQVRILVFAEKEEKAEQAVKAAFNRMAELEDIFSSYRRESELNSLISTAYKQEFKVSDELFYVLNESKSFAETTAGAFDVTLGPLIDLWKITRDTQKLPDQSTITDALTRVGSANIILDSTGQTVMLRKSNMKLDLGGIAKGFILDQALSVLTESGISSALIEAGGDIVVSDAPPGESGWVIEVPEAPIQSEIVKIASALQNAAIATSGDTEQFVEIDGKRYAHIINPKTGLGNTTRIMATVIAPDGITADKFATALTVLGEEDAERLLAAHPEVIAYRRKAFE